jgi:hypothetical protein
MPKWVKFIIALLLLPLCAGAARELWTLLTRSSGADTVWFPMMAGVGAWVSVYLLLPRPMWFYVLGHELTHVVWTWLFGGKVKKFKATSKGGKVKVTKTNCLICLAPYFFPFYAMVVVMIYTVGNLFWNWRPCRVWFYILLGAAYAFHITLTGHILKTEQSDITAHGWFFSTVLIFLGNTLILLIAIPLLTGSGELLSVLGGVFVEAGRVLRAVGHVL